MAPPPTPADSSLPDEALENLAQEEASSLTVTFRSPTSPQSPPTIVTTQHVTEPSGTSRPLRDTSNTFTFRAPNVSIPLHAPAPCYENYFHQFAFQGFFNPPPRFQSTLRTPANFMLPSNVTPETTLTYPDFVALVCHLEWTIRLLPMAFVTNPVPLSVITLDLVDRPQVINSPFWPNNLPHDAHLLRVLRDLLGEYNRFLHDYPH